MKYFTEKECSDDGVFTLDDFKMTLGDDLKEIELLEMKRDYGGEMWCDEDQGFVEKGNECVQCPKYSPCNGKNGRCRKLKNGFVETGKEFILTEFGLKEIK